jgi:hypothetical protein
VGTRWCRPRIIVVASTVVVVVVVVVAIGRARAMGA